MIILKFLLKLLCQNLILKNDKTNIIKKKTKNLDTFFDASTST